MLNFGNCSSESLAVSRIKERPMVIAYHLIWTAYGFWLPNDIRGSTSRALRNDLLEELGEVHFGRKWIQPRAIQVREFLNRAARVLMHSVLEFDAREMEVIAQSFE